MKLSEFRLPVDDRAEEIRAVIGRFNDNRTAYPRDKTVHALFAERAARAPDTVAILDGDGPSTYGELDRMSNRLARLLVGVGVGPGALVGVLLGRPFEMAAALLGILKAGAVYVPIDEETPFERMRYILDDTHAGVLVIERRWCATRAGCSGKACT